MANFYDFLLDSKLDEHGIALPTVYVFHNAMFDTQKFVQTSLKYMSQHILRRNKAYQRILQDFREYKSSQSVFCSYQYTGKSLRKLVDILAQRPNSDSTAAISRIFKVDESHNALLDAMLLAECLERLWEEAEGAYSKAAASFAKPKQKPQLQSKLRASQMR